MESIVTLVTELGSFGLLLTLAGFIIYNYVKNGAPIKTAQPAVDTTKDIIELKQMLNENTEFCYNYLEKPEFMNFINQRVFNTAYESVNK